MTYNNVFDGTLSLTQSINQSLTLMMPLLVRYAEGPLLRTYVILTLTQPLTLTRIADLRNSGPVPSIVLGGVCRYATAALSYTP